jgi:mannose-1-phosphate guanylyltransferase/phosphomannomutase
VRGMKAVVMAGGEGTRLRPLTSNRPKPMVPVANRPAMEHILRLLRAHDAREVVATLQYRAEAIEQYFGDGSDFGVELSYSVEPEPLGTAGSVRRCAGLLGGEPFLVISGDALTDFDLGAAVRFHLERRAAATLVLARVPDPLEYGVVIVDDGGRVARFLEKPGWGQVFSDTINTGIYVLDPSVLEAIPTDRPYDFSKDLFPRLLAEGAPVFGFVAEGYWCDIGSLDVYQRANEDALTGRVRLDVPGQQVRAGGEAEGEAGGPDLLWLGRGVEIDPGARIRGPVALGDNTRVRAGAEIEGPAVIGANCLIERGAAVRRGVLFPHVTVGPRSEVRGALLARGVRLGAGTAVWEGAVVGDGCVLRDGAQVAAGVRIWPDKIVEAGSVVSQSVVWGRRVSRGLFSGGFVGGDLGVETAVRLGAAFGSTLDAGAPVIASRDSHPASVMVKRALIAGLASAGARVLNMETTPLPVARYAVGAQGARGGVFVHVAHDPVRAGVQLRFLGSQGIELDAGAERGVETLFFRAETRHVGVDEVRPLGYPPKVADAYRTGYLSALGPSPLGSRLYRVIVDHGHGTAGQVLPQILSDLGCQALGFGMAFNHTLMAKSEGEAAAALAELGRMVVAMGAPLGLRLDPAAERLSVVDDAGEPLSGQELLVLFAHLAARHGGARAVAAPVVATSALESVGVEVLRTRTDARSLMRAAAAGGAGLAGDEAGAFVFPRFQPGVDGLFAAGQLISWLAREDRSLSALRASLPRPDVERVEVACPWEAKGRVMRRLAESFPQAELIDGVKVRRGAAWAAAIPDERRAVVQVWGEPGGHGLFAEMRRRVAAALEEEV